MLIGAIWMALKSVDLKERADRMQRTSDVILKNAPLLTQGLRNFRLRDWNWAIVVMGDISTTGGKDGLVIIKKFPYTAGDDKEKEYATMIAEELVEALNNLNV